MSILNAILDGVASGLSEAVGDNGVEILKSLSDPAGFESRDELTDALEAVFGEDLSAHFDRRTLANVLRHEAKTADDKASDAITKDGTSFIDRALDIFNEVRDDTLDAAMYELLKSEFGEGIRTRSLPSINAAIRAIATGEDIEADEGLIPDEFEDEDDPPLTDGLNDDEDDEDLIFPGEDDE